MSLNTADRDKEYICEFCYRKFKDKKKCAEHEKTCEKAVIAKEIQLCIFDHKYWFDIKETRYSRDCFSLTESWWNSPMALGEDRGNVFLLETLDLTKAAEEYYRGVLIDYAKSFLQDEIERLKENLEIVGDPEKEKREDA